MKRHFIFFVLLVFAGFSVAQPQSKKPTPKNMGDAQQGLTTEPVRKILASALEMRSNIAYAPVKQGKEIVGMAPFTGIALVMWPNNRVYTEQGYVNGLKHGKYQENTEKGTFVAGETALQSWGAQRGSHKLLR